MSVFGEPLLTKAQSILDACLARGVTMATAESCTGGLLGALLTELPGSSRLFTHGFITYANEAKSGMLGVAETLIETHGAVSEPVARAMAEGARKASGAQLAISITGIAGPGGGSETKPVGTVHLAVAMENEITRQQHLVFKGTRSDVRLAAVDAALEMILAELKN